MKFCLGSITDGFLGITHLKKIVDRVFNAILNNPLEIFEVEISGEHQRLLLGAVVIHNAVQSHSFHDPSPLLSSCRKLF